MKRTWEYPTGKREVENPRYRHAQERLRDFEKSAAGNKKTYDSTRCPSSGSQKSRIKAPAGTCADSYYSEWKRAERNAEAYRERLRSTSPRTWELVYSQHHYPAREDTAVAEVALTFDISFRNGQPAKRLEVDARVTRTAYSRAAEPRVQMPAAAETLPPDEALLDELRGEAVRRVAEAVGAARDGLLVQFEHARAAAEGDALLRAETTVRLDAARGKGGLAGVAEVVERRLGGGLGPAPLVPALLRPGTAALRFERTVDFAQVELDSGRHGSAYAAWALMGELADGALEARRLAARDVSAKHLDEQRLLSLSVEGAGASGAAVLAGLKAASARYAGFPADAAQLSPATPLRLTVTAAAPRISRTAGEVTLEQEVKEEPEENEAPAPPQKVPYAATRSAATLQGTVSVRAELGGRSVAFELPVTHVAEVFVHPARPETRLRARNEALPGDDVLVQAWARGAGVAALARVLEEGHAPVAPGPGPALDAALLRALRSADPRRGVDVQGLLPALEQAVGAVDAELLGEALARFRR